MDSMTEYCKLEGRILFIRYSGDDHLVWEGDMDSPLMMTGWGEDGICWTVFLFVFVFWLGLGRGGRSAY